MDEGLCVGPVQAVCLHYKKSLRVWTLMAAGRCEPASIRSTYMLAQGQNVSVNVRV